MKKLKMLAFLLCLLMISSIGTMFAFAEDTKADVWDGTVADSFSSTASGEKGDPILINSAAEFAYFAKTVNTAESYEDMYLTLNTDIDLANIPFAPIGGNRKYDFYFSGNFNGNGHTIKGLNLDTTVTNDKNPYVGLFGIVNKGGVIRNLNVEGSFNANTKEEFGIIAGKVSGGAIINCSVNVNANISEYKDSNGTLYVGGIVGIAQDAATIKDCVVKGTISVAGRKLTLNEDGTENRVNVVVGGIAGRANSNNATNSKTVKISNCINQAVLKVTVSNNIYVGGIVGVNNNLSNPPINDSVITVALENCVNSGNIVYEGTWSATAYTGGIFGRPMNGITIKNCYHSGLLPSATGGTYGDKCGIASHNGKASSVFENCGTTYFQAFPSSVLAEQIVNCSTSVSSSTVGEAADDIMWTIAENFAADQKQDQTDKENYVPGANDKEETPSGGDDISAVDTSETPNETQPTVENEANAQNNPDGQNEGGCGSTVGAASVIMLTVACIGAAAAISVRRSKEN